MRRHIEPAGILRTRCEQKMSSDKNLQEYLNYLNAQIRLTMSSASEEVRYEEDVFTEFVLNKLIEDGELEISEDSEIQEINVELFSGTWKGCRVRIDSFFIQPEGDGEFTLHAFITDYATRESLEDLPGTVIDSIYEQVFSFLLSSLNAKFRDCIYPDRAAKQWAELTNEYKDRLSAIKIWIISNRVADNLEDGTRRIDFAGSHAELSLRVLDLRSLANEKLNELDLNSVGGVDTLDATRNGTGYQCYLTVLPARYLVDAYSAYGPGLIEKNVRSYLGANKINKGIFQSVEQEPEDFVAFNNGLVIVADSVDYRDRRIHLIRNFQIVNGGQTTATLYRAFLQSEKNGGQKIADGLDKVFVPVKLIVIDRAKKNSDSFVGKISVAANSQTKIKTSDLSSGSEYYITFEEIAARQVPNDGRKWFFERMTGAYSDKLFREEKLGRKYAFSEEYPKSKCVSKLDIALAACCWDGEPIICAQGKEKAFKWFDEKFSENVPTEAEVRRRICQWMVFSALEKNVKDRISNPRVPVVYALALFSAEYSMRIDWEQIWQEQEANSALLFLLSQLTTDVNLCIRRSMGDMMIAMYGRKEECGLALKQNIDVMSYGFESLPIID